MNVDVKKGDLLNNREASESEILTNRTIKIIKKTMYDESFKSYREYFYGIVIYENNKEFYRPTYPFVRSKVDIGKLEQFVKKYENDLLQFYKYGHNYDFGRFVYGIGSGLKDKFREDWFKKGVIFY
ncbi:hypothetical protein DIX60_01325 [Streptococcus iniae]|uniref:hypothetical protein n=1 Tax=Streptococcus iniae TaxID=1346 RepID=UPI00037DFFD8|nr:hypothetical protein [Streptococcus iniae]ESR10148.1 hypothetical protein IUSA1_03250 [Streptococcus iniae IUSA1]KYJ82915.1 hypothetical protein NA30_01375 [Streptococcus iniae]RLV28629.1 hypothetical protein DIX60_01325 [Streptococcus iniae]RMI76817.1 hypothetical protein DIX59_01415 [Streptococcus iniae]HEK4517170.1 hypothetical protein [Streptococcus iniae]